MTLWLSMIAAVEVGGRQVDARRARIASRGGQGQPDKAPASVAPDAALFVPPATIAKVADQLPMRSGAVLTAAPGTLEADHSRQLRPVDGVQPAVLRADRHQLCPAFRTRWIVVAPTL